MTKQEEQLNDATFKAAHINAAKEFIALLQYIKNADDRNAALDEVENEYQRVLRDLTGGVDQNKIVYDMN